MSLTWQPDVLRLAALAGLILGRPGSCDVPGRVCKMVAQGSGEGRAIPCQKRVKNAFVTHGAFQGGHRF